MNDRYIPPQRNCVECGNSFLVPFNARGQKCCSEACSAKRDARQKERYKAERNAVRAAKTAREVA